MNDKKNIYSVPDGYFESLQTRLMAIPAQQAEPEREQTRVISLWSRVMPYVALAACFALAFFVGSFFLGRSSTPSVGMTVEDYYYADLIPMTDPYAIYAGAPDTYQVVESSEDDIVEYLISTGASVDYIAYLLNE